MTSQKIEAVHIRRFNAGMTGIGDPCIICGGKFKLDGSGCGHDGTETEAFIKRIKGMTVQQRRAILSSN